MENNLEQQLQRANQTIRSFHIRQALQESSWKKDLPLDQRESLVTAVMDHHLNHLGGQVVVEDGVPRIKRKETPELDLVGPDHHAIEFNSLVKDTIAKLGAPYPMPSPQQQDLLEARRQRNLSKLPQAVIEQKAKLERDLGIQP